MYYKFFVSIILFSLSLNVFSARCLVSGGENVTEDYLEKFNGADIDIHEKNVAKKLKNYTVIVVPGIDLDLLEGIYESNHIRWIRKYLRRLSVKSGRYKDYRKFFKKYDIRYSILNLDDLVTGKRSDKIEKIVEYIREIEGKIIFFAQGNGGADIMDALLRIKLNQKKHPEILDRVKGMVFLQSPFQGTPIAELLYNACFYDYGEKISRIARAIIGFDVEAAKHLSMQWRREYLDLFAPELNEIHESTGIISLSSSVPSHSMNYKMLILKPLRDIAYKFFQLDNDGIVPCGSSWPESKHVIVDNLDHATTLLGGRLRWSRRRDYDRKKLAVVLFSMLFEDMEQRNIH